MSKLVTIKRLEKEVKQYVEEIYNIERKNVELTILDISENSFSGAYSVKVEDRTLKSEVEEFIHNYLVEQITELNATKETDTNNSIAEAISEGIKEVVNATAPIKKDWNSVLIDDNLNRSLLMEYKDTIIAVQSIYGEGDRMANIDFTANDGTNYYWRGYGDILYLTIDHLRQFLDRNRKNKFYVKPLDEKLIKIFDLEEHYKNLERISNIEYLATLSPTVLEDLLKTLDIDRVTDIRGKMANWLKANNTIIDHTTFKEYLRVLDLLDFE